MQGLARTGQVREEAALSGSDSVPSSPRSLFAAALVFQVVAVILACHAAADCRQQREPAVAAALKTLLPDASAEGTSRTVGTTDHHADLQKTEAMQFWFGGRGTRFASAAFGGAGDPLLGVNFAAGICRTLRHTI